MELLCKRKIRRVFPDRQEEFEDLVVIEHEMKLYLNGNLFNVFYCSPKDLEELVRGYLFTSKAIKSNSDVLSIEFLNNNSEVYVVTKPSLGADFSNNIQRSIKKDLFKAENIIQLSTKFTTASDAFMNTGGIHSVAICSDNEILHFYEDIGRHNAMDKMIGYAIINDLKLSELFLLTSGRIPLEIVKKVSITKIPLLVSRSAPTDQGINLAKNSRLQLVGFSRHGRFNIYHDEGLIILP